MSAFLKETIVADTKQILMAAKAPPASFPYFFLFDFYLMKGQSDSNDVVPLAITYFYPTDEKIKEEKLLDCGGIIGIVQYFQHDLFRSVARTFHYQKLYVVHEHYGRHSAFLCVPDDQYTIDETQIYLKHILNLFNMLYGTWNHVQSLYDNDEQVNDFLRKALTPIVKYIFNQHRSVSTLFSTIEYTLLKNGNQRVLLESKNYLGYLKSKYGLHDGFIGYDDKILYSTCDPDTTFYLQTLFQLNNELSENLMTIPWDTEFKLRTGVSLFRIYIRQSFVPKPQKKPRPTNKPQIPTLKLTQEPINIFVASDTEDSRLFARSPSFRASSPLTSMDRNRLGVIINTDPSGSSEETGFETDTTDDLSSPSHTDTSRSSKSFMANSKDLNTEDSNSPSSASADEDQIGDEITIRVPKTLEQDPRSRTSTMSDEIEKTIEKDLDNHVDKPLRIHLTQVDSIDTTDDEEQGLFQIHPRASFDITGRERTLTITTNPDLNSKESSDCHDVQFTWTNIPDMNSEHDRDELVLYIQSNSRMMFAGVFEKSLLTDDYLKKLWSLMLSQMAHMETEIQVIPTANEMIKYTNDIKIHFNENTRQVKYEPIPENLRFSRRIPSEESTFMALFAQTELNRSSDRKVIGLSRGSHSVSIDRRLPDRIICSCRRFQETS